LFGTSTVIPVISPTTNDVRRTSADFQNMAVIFFSNRFCVISHHLWQGGDEREKVDHYESVKAAFAGKLKDLIQGAIKVPLVGN